MPPVTCPACGRSFRLVPRAPALAACSHCGAALRPDVSRGALVAVLLDTITTLYLTSKSLDLDADTILSMVRAIWTEREPIPRPE